MPPRPAAAELTLPACERLSGPVCASRSYVIGLSELRVADPRFTAACDQHAKRAAVFVRDALKVYAERHLTD